DGRQAPGGRRALYWGRPFDLDLRARRLLRPGGRVGKRRGRLLGGRPPSCHWRRSVERLDGAEQAVGFVVDTGSEVYEIRVTTPAAVAHPKTPQAVDLDRPAQAVAQLTREGTGRQVEAVDTAVAEVAHQQVIVEVSKGTGRDSQTPGRVQRALRGKSPDQAAVQVEDVDVAFGQPFYVVMLVVVLLCVGH